MKKKIAMLLALVLLVGCLTPALAAGEEPVPTQTFYDQFGPWGQWTEEQTAAAESWTEDNWYDYWDDYENALLVPYWAEHEQWASDYYGEDSEEQDWTEYLIQRRTEMGMPFPRGINVTVNGDYLDAKALGDEGAIVVGGRTLVPFRGFFEAQGATVRFEGGIAVATMKNGDILRMELTGTTLETVRDGKITTIDLGATPHSVDGGLYLPVRAAGESLGLNVYWDDTYAVAHLTDLEALQEEIDSQLGIFNRLLKAAATARDKEQTYATTENVTISGTLYGEKKHDTAKLSIDATGLTGKGGLSADVKLSLDLGGMEDTIFAELPEEVLELLKQLSNGRYSVIYNKEAERLYCKGDNLSLIDDTLPDNQWIASDFPNIFDSTVWGDSTIGSQLVQQIDGYYYYYSRSPWEMAVNQAQPYLLLFHDKNFTTTTAGDTTTYTLKLDMLKLAQRAAELGMLDGMTLSDLLGGAGELPKVELSLAVAMRGEKLVSFDLQGGMQYKGTLPVDMTFQMAGTPMSAKGSVAFKGAYVGKLEISMGSTAVATDKAVPTAPPSGEAVKDLAVVSGAIYAMMFPLHAPA